MQGKTSHRFDQAASGLGRHIFAKLQPLPDWLKDSAQEIRLGIERPVMIYTANDAYFVTNNGNVATDNPSGLFITQRQDIEAAFQNICSYSVHTHRKDIINGFITIKGGHRAGFCGTAVTDSEKIMGMKDISSINLRIARQIDNAANEIMKLAFCQGLCSALVAGPPACGKTTALRDMARQISSGYFGGYKKVVIVDERGELGAVYRGEAQNRFGPCCDILDGYPKGEGIMMALRCLSPDVIICDEIGSSSEIHAIEQGLNSGVVIIASIHANSKEDIFKKVQVKRLIATGGFQKIVLLKGRNAPCKVSEVIKVGDKDVCSQSGRDGFDYIDGSIYGLCPVYKIHKESAKA